MVTLSISARRTGLGNQDADADVAVYVDFDATSIFCMLH